MAGRSWRIALGMFVAATAASTALVGCSKGATTSPSPSPTDNGVSAMTAQEIVDKTEVAAIAQGSVQIVADQGTGDEGYKISVNMSKTNGASGTISQGKDQVEFYATEANVWIKASKEFWTKNSGAAAAEAIGTKWVKAPTSDPNFAQFSSFGNYTKGLNELIKPEGTATKGQQTEIDGQKAIILVSPKGEMAVATTGDPLPIQIKQTGSGTGVVKFSSWGSASVGSAPPDSDTIDVSKLTPQQ